MESIWKKECEFPQKEALNKDIKVDVAIIGAGMAGLLTAYMLREKGIKVVVLEGNRIASGQTMNTTAKITSQHSLLYDKLIKNFGLDKAKLYGTANEHAIAMYEKIIGDENISCHYEKLPAYVYTLDDVSKIEKEVEAAKKVGIDAEFTTETSLPFEVKGAVKFYNQAQFNPLEFLQKIIEPLTIYENTMVRQIEDTILVTDQGKIKADSIVVAAHYPFINIPGYYFARMHQSRSYVLCLKNTANLNGMYIDESKDGYSFRNYKDMLLLGGGGHRSGENTEGGKYEKLRRAAKEFYPSNEEICCWSAQDCMTIDDAPYIGRFSASTPNMFVATGFKKWGMTTSMVSAMLLSDMVMGKDNPFEEMFTPQRFQITPSIKNLINEGKHSVKGLIFDKLKVPDTHLKEIENGHGGIVEYEGEKIGVYKDEKGKVYMVSTTCTHLGCQLEWNPDELSWDCPCHGSRFDYTGTIINNPALENIEHDHTNE